METQAVLASPSQETVRELSARRDEPKWLLDLRLRALESYQESDLPDTVTHLWRYTDPSQFAIDSEEAILPSESSAETSSLPVGVEPSAVAGHLDKARFIPGELDAALRAKKVLLMDLHEAAHNYPALVESHLGRIVPETHGKFEALNLAAWSGGVFLHVPRNVVIEKPLHIVVSGDNGAPFLAQRILVVAEEGVEMTLVVDFTSPRGAAFHANTAVEIFGGANTNIKYVCVQHWSDQVKWYFTQRARMERDAQYLSLWAGLGSRITKTDIGATLDGPGANVKMYGITFAHKKQHFDQHTVHWHAAGRTSSDLDFKVVLKDKARSVYTGLIRIDERTLNCEAYQENRNLVVNDGPRVDTIPELEILNDEVRCSHGATIGPVDPMQVFYLRARGIPEEEAVRLIVAGFVETTLSKMPENVQERIHAYVADRLKDI